MRKLILAAAVVMFSTTASAWDVMSEGAGSTQSESGTKSSSATWGTGSNNSFGGAQNKTTATAYTNTCAYGCASGGTAGSSTFTDGKTWGGATNGESNQMQQGFGSASSSFQFRNHR